MLLINLAELHDIKHPEDYIIDKAMRTLVKVPIVPVRHRMIVLYEPFVEFIHRSSF